MLKKNKIIALVVVVGIVFSFSGCLKYSSNILEVTPGANSGMDFELDDGFGDSGFELDAGSSGNNPQQNNPQQNNPGTVDPSQQGSVPGGENVTDDGNSSNNDNPSGGTSQPVSPSSWTTAEILAYVTNAVTKTKAYTSQVTVNHAEAFDVEVTKAPGGSMIQNVANGIISSVVKPTNEVLTFNGGKTTNGEGETVPLLLPKRGAFTLTADGIASAQAKQSGDNIVFNIKLVKEVGTLTDHPKHHAASVGYLDASDVDLGVVTLNYLDITYTGSTLDLMINSDGYVVQAVYKIPVEISCEGKAMGFTAQIECVGQQSENWKINW